MPRKSKPDTIKIEEAYARCFSSPEGQIVLEDLRREYNERTTIPAGSLNDIAVHAMLVNEGARRLYLKIKQRVEAARNGGQPTGYNTGGDIFGNGSTSVITDDEFN